MTETITDPVLAATTALARVWADTAHLRGLYVIHRDYWRAGAVTVAAAALGVHPNRVYAALAEFTPPPWPLPARGAWVASAGDLIAGLR